MTKHPAVTAALRDKLGIPHDTKHVLIFSESSHWDPNWLYTSTDYFEKFVKSNLDQAITALLAEPRRIYTVECMFFLRMYWEACPEQHEHIRQLINNGQIRITSSGVTTADTILPGTEAILRDLLIGQEWLRENGLDQEPRLAYFTDSFGMTPALPSLLQAAGFDRTAFTRVDGMYFFGCDIESGKNFPRPNSTAEYLTNAKTMDFVWKDMNGAEVLAHWNAFTYGQGDMLAHGGLMRMYIMPIAFEARSDKAVAKKINGFAKDLISLSRTPYLFCPAGYDFVPPIEGLVGLLDRYNANHYEETGIWTVNAGLDDYLALIEPYKEELPLLEMDPNPYWTGFYTARPLLKEKAYTLTDELVRAEALSLLPENRSNAEQIQRELKPIWWKSATTNHHDLITGTSPDEVIYGESFPWIETGLAEVRKVMQSLSDTSNETEAVQNEGVLPGYEYHVDDLSLTITTEYYDALLSEKLGGAILRLTTRDGETLFAEPSNDLISYRDSGGLWRMGLEFKGGKWEQSAVASNTTATMQIGETEEGLCVITTHELDGETIKKTMWFRNDSPYIRCRVTGKAAPGHTINVRMHPGFDFTKLSMDAAGGVVERPPLRVYNPTFWGFQHFVQLDGNTEDSMAVVQKYPGAIAYQPDEGWLELVALRNANKEKAYGFINIPGNPAKGFVKDNYDFEYAFRFMEGGDWCENGLHLQVDELFSKDASQSLVTTDNPDISIAAVKLASRGEGIIVRLNAPKVPDQEVRLAIPSFKVGKAVLCDARERDLMDLETDGSTITLKMSGTIATVRILAE